MNLNETVHFKFERFETETDYDYFIIGKIPKNFQDYFEDYFGDSDEDDYAGEDYAEEVTISVESAEPVEIAVEGFKKFHRRLSHNIPDDQSVLILDGGQQINIWVTAQSIIDFDIYFLRPAL